MTLLYIAINCLSVLIVYVFAPYAYGGVQGGLSHVALLNYGKVLTPNASKT